MQVLRQHAGRDYPKECCGILIGCFEPERTLVTRVLQTENQRRLRARDRYEISPQDLLRAMREATDSDEDVVGYYHSHPDRLALPSSTDTSTAWPGVSYVIVAVTEGEAGEVRSWRCVEGTLLEETVTEGTVEGSLWGRKNG